MPRPRLKHLHREVSRHGLTKWFVRIGHGPRTRIQAAYGTPEFNTQYEAAIRGEPASGPRKAGVGTFQWLWNLYRESPAWARLAPATRKQRENIIGPVLAKAGHEPVSAFTRKSIVAARDKRADRPSHASHFLDTMRGLFAWAVEAEHVEEDPTTNVKNVPRPKTGGFPVWTAADLDAFEKRWPIGTRERLAFAILLYTGFRRGDAARLGPQHVSNGVISIIADKTSTPVTIPILPQLQAVLDASKLGNESLVAGANGKPMTKESFGNWFREVCDAAGVDKSAHGLRKAGATRAANNGATTFELNAIFGWSATGNIAGIYTREADRIRLAKEAMSKMGES